MRNHVLLVGAVIALPLAASGQKPEEKVPERAVHAAVVSRTDAVAEWPARSKELVQEMTAEYGDPDETTPTRVTWFGGGPWKQTTVYRDEIQHDFPKPHGDILEQTIEIKVPADKIDDLYAFDGSLTVHRTEGTLSSRCDDMSLNLLALNIAHDIITGDKTVKEARKAYARGLVDIMKHRDVKASERLLFDLESATADADKPFKIKMAD